MLFAMHRLAVPSWFCIALRSAVLNVVGTGKKVASFVSLGTFFSTRGQRCNMVCIFSWMMSVPYQVK